nr:hypothetical protein CFP56_11878 [Quercus suber]
MELGDAACFFGGRQTEGDDGDQAEQGSAGCRGGHLPASSFTKGFVAQHLRKVGWGKGSGRQDDLQRRQLRRREESSRLSVLLSVVRGSTDAMYSTVHGLTRSVISVAGQRRGSCMLEQREVGSASVCHMIVCARRWFLGGRASPTSGEGSMARVDLMADSNVSEARGGLMVADVGERCGQTG